MKGTKGCGCRSGYVGLPVAVAFGKCQPTIGLDINKVKIEELRKGFDRTGEVSPADLKASQVQYSADPADLRPHRGSIHAHQ